MTILRLLYCAFGCLLVGAVLDGATLKQQAECTIETDGTDVFVVFERVRIAKRGEPGTSHAGTRVSLEPYYEVLGGNSEQDPLLITRRDA